MNKILRYIFIFSVYMVLQPWNGIIFSQNTNSNPLSDTTGISGRNFDVKSVTEDPYNEQATSKFDLQDPENHEQVVEYDPATGKYIVKNKVGNLEIGEPAQLTFDEYKDYNMKQSLQNYWSEKNSDVRKKKGGPLDLSFDLGPAGAIFGEGGVQIKPQGYAELSFGVKTNRIDNYTLPERLRKTTIFDFDQKVQMNLNGSVGDKIKFGMNYNTEATFNFDNKINLNYAGKEDDIIKSIEAGNVSLPLSGSLIQGSESLFGFKTELQFGKLRVAAVFSQQESETQTINIQGGAATNEFTINMDEYDANRNFFLTHFFEQNYDKWMRSGPPVTSQLQITRIEVWVTNTRGDYDQARNVLPFMDLGESKTQDIFKPDEWKVNSAYKYPANLANNLYSDISGLDGIRDISRVSKAMSDAYSSKNINNGEDWEKVEYARLLSASEYYVNNELGYISLKSSMSNDDIVGVAFQYTYQGQTFQVGEFSVNNTDNQSTLIVKLLKGTSPTPALKNWALMMKNVYSLNAFQVNQEDFRFNILYHDDKTGTDLNFVPAGDISETLLIQALGLDRLNSINEPGANGFFDWREGYTIIPESGKIIFPNTKPFHSDVLGKAIGDQALAANYVFDELYDSTLVVAREYTEKNKFVFSGYYNSASGSEISLNSFNIPRGSVKVTAGGRELTENVDYSVDYNSGYLKILNTGLLESGTNIQVSLENQGTFNMQKKTMLGTNLDYQFSDDVNIGATVIHLYERPLTQKVNFGSDPISNTVWGINGAIKKDLPFLTRWIDALPFIDTKAPSRINFKGEFAQLIPGHSKAIGGDGSAYIDDFEATKIGIDIRPWQYWKLASKPSDFDENDLINDIEGGNSRAKIAWYRIDRMFQEPNSQTPSHIRNDAELLSNHYTRAVNERNLFPNKDNEYGEPTIMPVLNISYYPEERGPYNFDTNANVENGKLNKPEGRWAGITQRIDQSDFETSNVEYIEFWLMDPFIYDDDNSGKLVFNLGNVSEDVLRDGRKAFEHGLPISDDLANDETVEQNAWGYVPIRQSMVVAFENDEASRTYQDVGIDGINSAAEQTWSGYSVYQSFVANLQPTNDEDIKYVEKLRADIAQDDYHYFRGTDFDIEQINIFDRYKDYNNVESNSPTDAMSDETYATAATSLPDLEDLNQDNTLNENESYYNYIVNLDPNTMQVGSNRIVDTKQENVTLTNGVDTSITWYQFKVPVSDYNSRQGEIKDFRSIRFMRMYMTEFKKQTHLRFATFELVRGEWRILNKEISDDNINSPGNSKIETEAVNIEENSDREPINYVLPPDVDRVIDPGQPQLRQLNEQAMVMRVKNLESDNAKAAYKNLNMDLRQFKRLQMWVHAEKLVAALQGTDVVNDELNDYDLTLFVRLGSDYKNNYYEYEIPLLLTPEGVYDNANPNDRKIVWPEENQLNVALQDFIDLKLERNRVQLDDDNNINYLEKYYSQAIENNHRLAVMGNPTISRVQTIMIGIRNSTAAPNARTRSGEVWVNELRLTTFNEDGGWAGLANVNIQLADLGQVTMAGKMSTSGWGGIEQKLMERQLEDVINMDISTNLQLGKFFPEEAKVNLPIYYAYSQDIVNPKYNPLDEDVLLQDAIDNATDLSEKEAIKKNAQQFVERRSFNISNAKVGITGEKKQFFDANNFSANFAYNEMYRRDPSTDKEITKQYKGGIAYNFSPNVVSLAPFEKAKVFESESLQSVRDFNLTIIPQQINFRSDMNRNYNELQLKDLSNSGIAIPKAIRKDWFWNSSLDVAYNPAKSISLNLSVNTNTIIDEPYEGRNGEILALDKHLYPDEYSYWRDSVMVSLSNFGRVTGYNQSFNARWDVPLSKVPILSWITMDMGYASTYRFERGPAPFDVEDSLGAVTTHNVQHNIRNTQSKTINTGMNFLGLFNKSKYLRDINRKYGRAGRSKSNATKSFKTVTFEQKNVDFTQGDPIRLNHKLKSKKVTIRVYDENNRPVPGERNEIDEVSAEFTPTQNKENGRIVVTARVEQKESKSDAIIGKTLRFLMMPRNFSANYAQNSAFVLPGFREVGHLGQAAGAPGLDFAFGSQDIGMIDRADQNGWLTKDALQPDMYYLSKAQQFNSRLTLEPINSLKIEFNASWAKANSQSAFYKYTTSDNINYDFDPGVNYNQSGNFTMTWMAIGVPWGIGSNYESEPFDELKANREVIARRLASDKQDNVPNYDPNKDGTGHYGYDLNSSEVLIPAFLSAYSKKNAGNIFLTAFPSLAKMLPNWRVSYSGLSKIPWFKDRFRSITLNHAYQSTYSVGSYLTNPNYYTTNSLPDPIEGLDFFIPEYDIASVTITESFSPLINVDMQWKNSFTTKIEYRRIRTMNLNAASNQLVEMLNNEFVVGLGYRWDNFNLILNSGGKSRNINNDLTLRGDVSLRDIKNLIRQIDREDVQPTSGQNVFSIKFSADYVLSRSVNIRLFYDRMLNKPLISSSFTTGTSNFGVAFRFTLAN